MQMIYGRSIQDNKQEQFFEKYRNAFGQRHLRELMASVSTYMILDDHEIRNNWNQDWVDHDSELRDLLVVAMSAYQPYQVVHGPAYKQSNRNDADNRPRRLWYNFDCGVPHYSRWIHAPRDQR